MAATGSTVATASSGGKAGRRSTAKASSARGASLGAAGAAESAAEVVDRGLDAGCGSAAGGRAGTGAREVFPSSRMRGSLSGVARGFAPLECGPGAASAGCEIPSSVSIAGGGDCHAPVAGAGAASLAAAGLGSDVRTSDWSGRLPERLFAADRRGVAGCVEPRGIAGMGSDTGTVALFAGFPSRRLSSRLASAESGTFDSRAGPGTITRG